MNTIIYLHAHHSLFLTLMGIFGLIVGSFLNVVIYRLPIMIKQQWERESIDILGQEPKEKTAKINLAFPGSHCPQCKKSIKAQHNVPIISYILLHGKCKSCGKKISIRYPIVEFLGGFLTIIVVAHFGFTIQSIPALILVWTLIVLAFIDIEHLILPDVIMIPLIWLGLFVNIFNIFTNLTTAVLGAICGYLVLWLVAFLFKILRGLEGMGHGDFKLLALFGAWLGWHQLPFIILAASLAGALVGIFLVIIKKYSFKRPIPFGPFLITAGICALFWGQEIITWYLKTIGIH